MLAEHGPVDEGELLWTPPDEALENSEVGRFIHRLRDHEIEVDGYPELWQWSVTDIETFWQQIVEHFDVDFVDAPTAVLTQRSMPGARWFPGATLNYAAHALRHTGDEVAVVARSQSRADRGLSRDQLVEQVTRAAAGLRRLGVGKGDRVAAYMPNIPETLVGFLATASLGAIWSSCSPEMGVGGVTDRLAILKPKVLLTIDGYRYGSKTILLDDRIDAIVQSLPSIETTVVVPYLGDDHPGPGRVTWDAFTADNAPLVHTPVPFDHPLFVLFSSGTSGPPKAIMHGHGGILLEHLKILALHHDIKKHDRFFWFTTTSWMMWNYLVSGLLLGATVVLFDGDPRFPDESALWRLASEKRVTYFGVSAAYLVDCEKHQLRPRSAYDLSSIEGVGSTGAPLPARAYRWVYDHVGSDLVLGSVSGGTDVCTGFVGPSPLLPVHAGEIQCRILGAKVEALDPGGLHLSGAPGELVISEPMPSMPVGFWADEGDRRYREAYFTTYPGLWRHGDWIQITDRGSCIVSGRSDATLNRGGVRTGTAEYYRALDGVIGLDDSLVVHLTDAGGSDELLLFVALNPIDTEPGSLIESLPGLLRHRLGPRHVPDRIIRVAGIPRTPNGKRLELPVRRILQGEEPDEVLGAGTLRDPSAIVDFVDFARRRHGDSGVLATGQAKA